MAKDTKPGMARIARLGFLTLLVVAAMSPSSEARAADLSGYWSGYWANSNNRHTGPLRATFTKINESQYRVKFTGRFFKIVPFNYSVVLNVVEENEVTRLRGTQYVGRRYGTFCYRATVTGCKFTAHYTSKKFNGKFVLTKS